MTTSENRQSVAANPITFEDIQKLADLLGPDLREVLNLPSLPAEADLSPYRDWMREKDPELIIAVQDHLHRYDYAPGHSFEAHLEPIATLSAYAADIDCQERQIGGERREKIIQRAWRLGLMHDLQRVRGYMPDENHQVESFYAARQIFSELEIEDTPILRYIAIHDNLQIIIDEENTDPDILIPFCCMFVADKLIWGKNPEKMRWVEAAQRHSDPSQEIHRYHHLNLLLESGILEVTKFGREIVRPYIEYGVKLCEHIEGSFT